jgi:hypothetical protein
LAIAPATAQQQRKQFYTETAVVESTKNVFPQINETYSDRPLKPSNPSVTIERRLSEGKKNSLRAGRNRTALLRGKARGDKFPGIGATGYFPPDPDLAVGPSHVVQVVNSSIAFFEKSNGNKVFQQGMDGNSGFFSGVSPGNFVFDPKVFFDQVSRRFFVVALDVDFGARTSNCLVAVSDDADPAGSWFKYKINSKLTVDSREMWLDYPGFGYNKDAVVITGNMFGFTTGSGGTQFISLQKEPLLSGQPALTTSIYEPTAFTVQMANTMDATADVVYGAEALDTSTVRIFALSNLLGTPTLESANVTVPNIPNVFSYADSTDGAYLDTLPFRMMNAAYRGGMIYAAHSIGISDSDPRMQVRWYEINANGWPASGDPPTLSQSGNVAGNAGEFFFMPAITANKFGDVSIVFTRSSTSKSADAMYVARKKDDPKGTMGRPTLIIASSGSFPPGANRYGDYYGNKIDPNDDSTFWGNWQTIRNDSNWDTVIQKFTVTTDDGSDKDRVRPIGVIPVSGNVVNGSLVDLFASDDSYYELSTTLDDSLGAIAAAEFKFVLPRTTSEYERLQFRTETLGTSLKRTTAMIFAYDWLKGSYVHVRSFRAFNGGNNQVVFNMDESNMDRFVNEANEMKFVVRTIVPYVRNRGKIVETPAPYILKQDFVEVVGTIIP